MLLSLTQQWPIKIAEEDEDVVKSRMSKRAGEWEKHQLLASDDRNKEKEEVEEVDEDVLYGCCIDRALLLRLLRLHNKAALLLCSRCCAVLCVRWQLILRPLLLDVVYSLPEHERVTTAIFASLDCLGFRQSFQRVSLGSQSLSDAANGPAGHRYISLTVERYMFVCSLFCSLWIPTLPSEEPASEGDQQCNDNGQTAD